MFSSKTKTSHTSFLMVILVVRSHNRFKNQDDGPRREPALVHSGIPVLSIGASMSALTDL